jgi:hypothetical protein
MFDTSIPSVLISQATNLVSGDTFPASSFQVHRHTVRGPADVAYRPLYRATNDNSGSDFSGVCRIEPAAFVVRVRGGSRGWPDDRRR